MSNTKQFNAFWSLFLALYSARYLGCRLYVITNVKRQCLFDDEEIILFCSLQQWTFHHFAYFSEDVFSS